MMADEVKTIANSRLHIAEMVFWELETDIILEMSNAMVKPDVTIQYVDDIRETVVVLHFKSHQPHDMLHSPALFTLLWQLVLLRLKFNEVMESQSHHQYLEIQHNILERKHTPEEFISPIYEIQKRFLIVHLR